MFGIEESMARLACMIALLGLVPSGIALASERSRGTGGPAGPVQLAGVVETVRREHLLLRAEDGRPVRVEAEGCAAAAVVGERVVLTGRRDRSGEEFEPQRMLRPDGTALACREDRHLAGDAEESHRLAAAAPVDAAAAIAAAERAGHGRVTGVEWDHGAWRLRARDATGMPVRLQVDGWTGQVSPGRR